jgi:hypothetical protein
MSILCNNDFINISIPKGQIQYDNLLIGGCFVCDSWLPLSSYNLCNSSSSSIISTNAQKRFSKNLSRAAYEILKARGKKRTDGPISELQVKVKETKTFFLSIGENCRTKFNDRNWMETERNYIAYPGA